MRKQKRSDKADPREQLQDYLDEDVAHYMTMALRTEHFVQVLWVISLLASVAAAVLVAGDWGHRALRTTITLTPAVVQTILSVFKIQTKIDWHFEMNERLERLADALRFRNGKVDEISEKRNDLNTEMNKKYPRIGGKISIHGPK